MAFLFVFMPLDTFRLRSIALSEVDEKGLLQTDRTLPQVLALCLVVILTAVLAVHGFVDADAYVPPPDDPANTTEQVPA